MPDFGGGGKNYMQEFWIAIRADLSGLTAGLAASKVMLTTYTSKLGAASLQMKKFGKRISMISVALLALSGLAVRTFAKFEQSMANTFSVLGATTKQMQLLSKFAREMGRQTIFTASEAADAMYYLASAGFDTGKIMSSLKGILDLTAATQYDLAESTRIVVSTLNAFRFGASESSRVANVFSAIISASQATMDRLGESMKFIAPVAANLNISLEEMTATLGLLFNAGLAASTSATGMRQSLLSLLNPVPDARDALKQLGLTVMDVSPQFNNLTEILQAFERAGAGATEKIDLLSEIFSRRAIAPWLILLKTGSKELIEMQKKITGTNKAQEMARIQLDTLSGSMKLFVSAIQEMAIAFSVSLIPTLRSVILKFRDLVNTFNKLTPATQSTIAKVMTLAGSIGLLTGITAILVSKIPAMVTGLKTLNVLWGISFGKIMLVVTALGYATYGLFNLITAQERQKRVMEENITRISEYLIKRKKESQTIKDLTSDYVKLSKMQGKYGGETAKMNTILGKLNEKYPMLIKNTQIYEGAVSDVEKVSREATIQIIKMSDALTDLQRLKLTIELSQVTKEIGNLKESLEDTSFLQNLRDVLGFNFDKEFPVDFSKFKDTFKKTFQELEESTDFTLTTRQASIDMVTFDRLIRKVASDSEGVKRVQQDALNINNRIMEITAERLDIENDNVDVSDQKLNSLKDEESILIGILSFYTDALEKSEKLTQKSMRRTEIEKQLLDLGKAKVERPEPDKRIVPEDRTDVDAEIEFEKRKQELLFSIRKKAMDSELELKRQTASKGFSEAMEFINLEYENKLFFLERERQVTLNEAKETGVSEIEINKRFNAIKLVNEKLLLIKINALKEKYNEDASEKLKQRVYDEQSLLEENLRFRAEREFADDKNFEGAIKKYAEFLNEKLVFEEEFSSEYLRLKNELYDLEEALKREQMERIQKYSLPLLRGIGAGISGLWEQWIVGARRAKNEMDAIWLAMKNSFLRAVGQMVTAEITKLLLKLISGTIGFGGLGIGNAIANVANAAFPTGSAVGSQVKTSGLHQVHAGETIVPATVVRKNEDEYKKVLNPLNRFEKSLNNFMDKFLKGISTFGNFNNQYSNVPIKVNTIEVADVRTRNNNATTSVRNDNIINKTNKSNEIENSGQNINNFKFIINNPIVNDDRYWEQLTEDYLNPVIERINKRTNDKL